MNPKQLFTDDDAVSPVIGVILMVAITVILAAVIATFVLGLGDQVSQNNPQASFSFSYDSGTGDLTISHDGGAGIDPDNLFIRGDLSSGSGKWTGSTSGSEVKAGNSYTVEPNSDSSTVNVIWENPNGDNSATLGTWNGN
jgi:flagellin-like protein